MAKPVILEHELAEGEDEQEQDSVDGDDGEQRLDQIAPPREKRRCIQKATNTDLESIRGLASWKI